MLKLQASQGDYSVNFNLLTRIPLFTVIPVPGTALSAMSFTLPKAAPFLCKTDVPPSPVKTELILAGSLFSMSFLFAKVPTKLELKRDMDMMIPVDWENLETEFPYPFYMEDEDWAAPKKTKKTPDEADAGYYEIAAQRVVRFPQPRVYNYDLEKASVRKARRTPSFLKGAKLLARMK